MKIAMQVFDNGEPLGEYVFSAGTTEQAIVDDLFRHARIDFQYRFLGSYGFIIPTGKDGDYMLFNGGRA
jgi:hypothetical protein